jgi:hypothetical protein
MAPAGCLWSGIREEKPRRVTQYGLALHRAAANSNVMLTIGGISRCCNESRFRCSFISHQHHPKRRWRSGRIGLNTGFNRGIAGIRLLYGLLQLLDYFEDNVVWIVDEHPNSVRMYTKNFFNALCRAIANTQPDNFGGRAT